jgi:dinuclear metal center YbgI/SA1388 family protein
MKTVYLKNIVGFLDELLEIEKISDYSLNGLQVEGKSKVEKIGFSVDLSLETIKKCVETNTNMIVVHHGIFWKNSPVLIKGLHKKRFKLLLENDISVYAAHLPLDLHKNYGNNIQICKKLNLKNISTFGNYNGIDIAYCGTLSKTMKFSSFCNFYQKQISLPSHVIESSETVKKIGVVSGGGASVFPECEKLGIDTFITGEQNYTIQNFAIESGINVIFGGHYNTEVFGVQALQKLISKKYNINTVFFDVPTAL